MKINYYDVHVEDQLQPACGSGMRTVVAITGHKWVRVKACYWYNNRNYKRVSRKIWDSVKPTLIDDPNRLKSFDKITKAHKKGKLVTMKLFRVKGSNK